VQALGQAGRIPPVLVGIGLHAGEAVTGNIGSAQRQQYSVTGNVVILASREVLEHAGALAGARSLGPQRLKGREQPIEVFRIA